MVGFTKSVNSHLKNLIPEYAIGMVETERTLFFMRTT
jgi:hypothetical protein